MEEFDWPANRRTLLRLNDRVGLGRVEFSRVIFRLMVPAKLLVLLSMRVNATEAPWLTSDDDWGTASKAKSGVVEGCHTFVLVVLKWIE